MRSVSIATAALVIVGCGGSPVRALRVRDAVRAAVCEAVLGAADTEAVVEEVEVNVGRTTTATFGPELGIEGMFSVSLGEASIENESSVTIHVQRGDDGEGLPSADQCLELNARGFPVYELRRRENNVIEAVQVAGTVVPGTTGFAEAQIMAASVVGSDVSDDAPTRERGARRISRALCDGPGRHWREPASTAPEQRSPASRRCDASLDSTAVMWNVRTDGAFMRWQLPVPGGVNDCVCTAAESSGGEQP
jgi:hypothetical protein